MKTKMSNSSPLDDKEVKKYIALSQTGDEEARSLLVEKNIRLVWSVVQRFQRL